MIKTVLVPGVAWPDVGEWPTRASKERIANLKATDKEFKPYSISDGEFGHHSQRKKPTGRTKKLSPEELDLQIDKFFATAKRVQ